MPDGFGAATLAGVTVVVVLVTDVFVESVRQAGAAFGMTTAFVGFIVAALVGGAGEMASAFSAARKKSDGFECEYRARRRVPNRALCRPDAGASQLCYWPGSDEPTILAGCDGHGAYFHYDSIPGRQQRTFGVVWSACTDGIPDCRHDASSVTAPNSVKVG